MTEVNNLSPDEDVSEINDEETSFVSEQLRGSNRLILFTDLTALLVCTANQTVFIIMLSN